MTRFFLALYNFFFIHLPVSVGDFTDYDTGGSDFGGSDFGGSDFGGSDFSGFSGGSSSGSGRIDLFDVIVVIAIIVVVFLINRKQGKARLATKNPIQTLQPQPQMIETIVNKIKEHDKGFSRDAFLSWAEQTFITLQEAWMERDWKKARPFESESLFNTHKAQLDQYIKNGTINMMENVCVNRSFICDYYQDADKEYMTVFMETRYNDYIIKEDTKEVVKGNPKTRYYVNYKAKFMRTVGVETGELSNKSTKTCPNCGAPVDVNAAGQCAYCGTIITDGTHDWVLCDLDECGQNILNLN